MQFHYSLGYRGVFVLAAALLTLGSNGGASVVSAFQQPTSSSNFLRRAGSSSLQIQTALHGKAWDKLGIEEDDDFYWYCINCIAGSEIELLAQCKKIQPELSESDCRKFVVPQERQLRSHGQKNVVDVKALYPGYVFAHLRLCPETYEKIQAIPLTRSWMGTVHMKGMRRLPVIPVALNDDEIEKFRLLEAETDAMFAKYGDEYDGRGDAGDDLLHQYAGYEVDGMVKVLTGKHKGEDGVVKRLKDGKIKVRLYTYGSTFDEWYDVTDIRPMTDAEVLKGLTGPEGPIRQEDFDISIGKKPKDYHKRGAVDDRTGRSLRSDLYSSMGQGGRSSRGNRNTRFDRQARGARGGRGEDRFGRSDAQLEEEERNWREYREQQREQRSQKRQGTWGMRGAKEDWKYEETKDVTDGDFDLDNYDEQSSSVLGDADAQWGRQISSGRQERRMRRGGRQWQDAGPSQSLGIESALDGDDDWTSFAQQQEGGGGGGDGTGTSGSSESDDFFDSLLNELSDSLDSADTNDGADFSSRSSSSRNGNGNGNGSGAQTFAASGSSSSSDDDDFFSSLIDDLDSDKSSSIDGGGGSSGTGTTAEDDFFASLEADLDDVLGGTTSTKAASASSSEASSSDDDFFNDLADDLFSSHELASPTTDESSSPSSSSSPGDLSSLTVPVLKGMLKERGLKVSGKKSDLIERLQSS